MATRVAPEAQEALATARYIRISPNKARAVVNLIRGRHVDDARRVLQFTARGPSETVLKVLNSAIANAEHNRGLAADELVVARAWVDEGPTLRRFRPRAMGRATRVRKRTCHISVIVGRSEEFLPQLEPAPRKRAAKKDDEGDADTAPKKKTTRTAGAKASSSGSSGTAKKTTAKKTTAKKTTAKSTAKKTAAKRASGKKTGGSTKKGD